MLAFRTHQSTWYVGVSVISVLGRLRRAAGPKVQSCCMYSKNPSQSQQHKTLIVHQRYRDSSIYRGLFLGVGGGSLAHALCWAKWNLNLSSRSFPIFPYNLFNPIQLRSLTKGCRDGSAVDYDCCSSRGPELRSHNACWVAHSYIWFKL